MERNKILVLPIAFNRSELVLSLYDPTGVPRNLDRSPQCANPRPLGPKPYKAQFQLHRNSHPGPKDQPLWYSNCPGKTNHQTNYQRQHPPDYPFLEPKYSPLFRTMRPLSEGVWGVMVKLKPEILKYHKFFRPSKPYTLNCPQPSPSTPPPKSSASGRKRSRKRKR